MRQADRELSGTDAWKIPMEPATTGQQKQKFDHCASCWWKLPKLRHETPWCWLVFHLAMRRGRKIAKVAMTGVWRLLYLLDVAQG